MSTVLTVNYSNTASSVDSNTYVINGVMIDWRIPVGSSIESKTDLLVIVDGLVQQSSAFVWPTSGPLANNGIRISPALVGANSSLQILSFNTFADTEIQILSTNTFITLADVKNYLQITSNTNDGRLQNIISYATSAVEDYIGYPVQANNYVEIHDGGTSSIFTKRIPINYIQKVIEFDGSTNFMLSGPSNDGALIDKAREAKTVTASGPTITTRYSVFNRSAGQFDGVNDYLTIADSDDFWLENLAFTMEGYFRINNYSNSQSLISQYQNAANYLNFYWSNTQGLTLSVVENGTQTINVSHAETTGYTANQFLHMSVSRTDSGYLYLHRNGVHLSNLVSSNSIPNFSAPLEIGRLGNGSQYFSGQMDEIRITLQNNRYASSNFTVVNYPFTTDANTVLLIHMDGTKDSSTFTDSSVGFEDYIWYSDTGEIVRGVSGSNDLNVTAPTTFKDYPKAVTVYYNAGYNPVPNDLKLAALDLVKIYHKQTQDSQIQTFQGESTHRFFMTPNNFPPHIRRILDLYRIIM